MNTTSSKPEIRVLHHMARSGGTVISRCLGSMDRVILLSEIHPQGRHIHSPLQQAIEWFGLFAGHEVRAFSQRRFTFIEAIETIRQRVVERGDQLVIRDWSHLDFTGVPFIEHPTCRLTLSAELSRHYTVIPAFTVRHPLDQWISLNNLTMFENTMHPDPAEFIHGYLRFAEFAHDAGFVRYEDFSRDSDTALQSICDALELPFDRSYRNKWKTYNTISGDNTTPSKTRRGRPTSIDSLPRQPVGPDALETLERFDDYRAALKLLGYPPA